MRLFIFNTLLIALLTVQSAFATTPKQRQKQINKIVEITKDQICNPHFLNSQEWQKFTQDMARPEVLDMSDKEFVVYFNKARKQLPFTHYYLKYTGKDVSASISKRPSVSLEEIDAQTALLTLTTWSQDASILVDKIKTIQEKGYNNLIIDLRNNFGGTLDGAVVLGQFLTQETIDAGVYLTRNWFESTTEYPSQSEIETFPYLTDMSYHGFKNMMRQPGFRMVIPAHNRPVFKGKVMVLTNQNTASTNEPFVHLIKQEKIGTIIGETTNGAMMSGSYFKVSKQIKLFLPVADYVTANGDRLDRVGVTPNVITTSDQALEVAKSMLQ